MAVKNFLVHVKGKHVIIKIFILLVKQRALNFIKVVAGKKWRGDQKTLKNYPVQYI